MNDNFQTPQRKFNNCEYQSDPRYKYSTIDSRAQRNSRFFKENDRWQHHQQRRQNRMSSLLKARKQKLQEITGQNRKIFIRITNQQSHYPTYTTHQSVDKYRPKENVSEKLLGPIGIWQAGARGIMCDRMLTFDNIVPKNQKKGHILPKLQSCEKQNILEELIMKTHKQTRTPYRQRNLSDLYMLI